MEELHSIVTRKDRISITREEDDVIVSIDTLFDDSNDNEDDEWCPYRMRASHADYLEAARRLHEEGRMTLMGKDSSLTMGYNDEGRLEIRMLSACGEYQATMDRRIDLR